MGRPVVLHRLNGPSLGHTAEQIQRENAHHHAKFKLTASQLRGVCLISHATATY